MGRGLEHFSEDAIQMVSRYMKKLFNLTNYQVNETQKMRYHLSSQRLEYSQKIGNKQNKHKEKHITRVSRVIVKKNPIPLMILLSYSACGK